MKKESLSEPSWLSNLPMFLRAIYQTAQQHGLPPKNETQGMGTCFIIVIIEPLHCSRRSSGVLGNDSPWKSFRTAVGAYWSGRGGEAIDLDAPGILPRFTPHPLSTRVMPITSITSTMRAGPEIRDHTSNHSTISGSMWWRPWRSHPPAARCPPRC